MSGVPVHGSSVADAEHLPWKTDILTRLQRRNRSQADSFRSVFEAYGKLFDSSDALKSQNISLSLQNEKLKEENLKLILRGGDANNPNDPKIVEKINMLEQKIFKQQEELTDMHRKKGDNAQQLVDFRNQLQDKERVILERDRRISDLESTLYSVRQALKMSESQVLELSRSNELLKDEQQALHIAYTSMEEKFRRMTMENQELIDRWLRHKAAEVDRMNQEAEDVQKANRASMQKEIMAATKETVAVNMDNLLRMDDYVMPPVCCVIIPSTAQKKIDAHDGEVNAVTWSPTGRFFATGGSDRKVKLWEAGVSGVECKGVLTGSNAAVMSVQFDSSDSLIVGASNDFAARVWTLNDQRLRHTLTGHSGKVMACKFFSGPNRVVSGSHDRTLKIWDLRSRACQQTIFAGSSCNDLVLYGSQNIISGHFDKKIRFWDTRSENSVNEHVLGGKVTSLDLSPDGLYLLACSRDDMLKVIDVRMNQVTAKLGETENSLTNVPVEHRFSKRRGIYMIAKGVAAERADGFRVGCDWLRAVFSPDGQYVMAGSNDGTLYVWNLRTDVQDNVEKMLKEHTTTIQACSWHPQGNQLLSCDKNKKVILWSDMPC